MNLSRFNFFLRSIRFDDRSTFEERVKQDKFAAIRKLWNDFIAQCVNSYIPGLHITVNEQLLAFRDKCALRMYIANKPAKYGIKLVMACDVQLKYMLNALPYFGKGTTRASPASTLAYHLTKTLVAPYAPSNRNVSTDNWFTSMELAKDLMDNCGMTIVGTLRSNKKYLRAEIVDVRNRSKQSSAFLYYGNITLLSYVPNKKKKKNVLLLSSMHHQQTIEENGMPEIVMYYNSTKGG